MRYERFATFNCQGILNKVKQMNIADDFCHHQLTAMMIQETHMQGHGLHQVKSSSVEKLHLYLSGHKNRSITRTGIIVTPNSNFLKQKNFCSRLYKKETKRFLNSLNRSFVTDNILFWKTIKPFFSNNGNYGSQIKLIEKDDVLQDDDLIAKELNKFFKNAVSTLNIKENSLSPLGH